MLFYLYKEGRVWAFFQGFSEDLHMGVSHELEEAQLNPSPTPCPL